MYIGSVRQKVDACAIKSSGLLSRLHEAGAAAVLPAFVKLSVFRTWLAGPSAWHSRPTASRRRKARSARRQQSQQLEGSDFDQDSLHDAVAVMQVNSHTSLKQHVLPAALHA